MIDNGEFQLQGYRQGTSDCHGDGNSLTVNMRASCTSTSQNIQVGGVIHHLSFTLSLHSAAWKSNMCSKVL